MTDLSARTISDFGDQWLAYQDNEGYYASAALLEDISGPLLASQDLTGCKVADIGSGTGRIVDMLLACDVQHVVALEPSQAFEVLKTNTREQSNHITYLNTTGNNLPSYGDIDYVFSIGVLHHVPDPQPTVRAAYSALRPGGRFLVWLYGKEGNELYLLFTGLARLFTTRLPDPWLKRFVRFIDIPLVLYIHLCQRLALPLHRYMRNHMSKLTPSVRRLTIFDQLNPAYAKYYSYQECRILLEEGGFTDIHLYHRHGYSWTAIGTKRY
ncbi:MAG: class I SAM-dependent methyltransferase [Spirulinaceae cyanobacterium SM2_1_0]|nr:class I SAM-dependent methyltransferase [Spirulinaceae cyanobacterium SM2_1_0]